MTAIDKSLIFKDTVSPFGGRKVVDVDTHLTEPHDLWTSRAPASLKDRVPQVKMIDGVRSWVIDGDVMTVTGKTWKENLAKVKPYPKGQQVMYDIAFPQVEMMPAEVEHTGVAFADTLLIELLCLTTQIDTSFDRRAELNLPNWKLTQMRWFDFVFLEDPVKVCVKTTASQ